MVRKVSGQPGYFPDGPDSFQIAWKISKQPVDQILENDASEELKTTDIIAGESNEMDKNEDEIHQDKLGHAHTEEDTVYPIHLITKRNLQKEKFGPL